MMDMQYSNKQIITIEYPGTVVNIDNMSRTLGGEKEIFSVLRDPTKRLELRFRPDDPFCKSAHGDRFNSTNLLIKVVKRTRKKPKNTPLSTSEPSVEYKVEFLGIACTTYKFNALADFQVLPITVDKNKNKYRSLIPDIVPTELYPSSWLDQEVELFVPSLLYSRFDFPQNGYVDIQSKSTRNPLPVHPDLPPNIIGRSRKRRAGFAVFTTFESTDIVDKPQPEALAQLQTYTIEIDIKKKLDALFKERPIWTRNALLGILKCDRARLKHSLPCTAYYFTNGPWRASWVRFGYNPRKDPASKVLQIMDVRINPSIPINDKKNKRRQTYYTLPNKSYQNQQRVATINTDYLVPASKDDGTVDNSNLIAYEYIPGQLPTTRQCFFQLCDIHLEAVQRLVHQNDGQEETCHEKDGWCELGTLEKCRELLIADIIKNAKELKETGG